MTTWTHADLAHACGDAKPQADGSFKTNCPAHEDKVQSLHVSEAGGKTLVSCMAGCDQETVWKLCTELMSGEPQAQTRPTTHAPSQTPRAILPAPEELDIAQIKHREFGTPTLVYEYRDLSGALHFYNCRFEFPEGSKQREQHGRKTHRPYICATSNSLTTPHRWRFAAPEKGQRIPYRLDKLKPDGVVMIHEGEKAANAGAELLPEISHLGWWGGASNARHTDWNCITGRTVWMLPDADPATDNMPDGAGVDGMDKLRDILTALNCDIIYCRNVKQAMTEMGLNPDENTGFDAADVLELGWDRDQFTRFLDIASDHQITGEVEVDPVEAFERSMAAAKQKQGAAAFLPLGYNADTYYYLSRATKQIHSLSPTAHKRPSLISICPMEAVWSAYVPPKKQSPDWDAAAARMMSECHRAGLFNPDNIRGRGAWYDEGKVVIHLGDRLVIDGVEADIMTRPGRFIYELGHALHGPGDTPMTDDETAHIYDTCRMFSWENPLSADYLMGWIALAPICGALKWRPHVWLTGPQGAGKSTIENHFVAPLLGNMKQSVQGNSTEAGIRQTLKYDALPVLIDEAEQENENTRQRGEAIIQMIRQASSETDAKTLKGGVAGQSASYHIRSMFLLGSIGTSIRQAADQARITKLTLYKNSERWREIKQRLDSVTPEDSRRLICRLIQLIPVIRQNTDLLADRIRRETGSQRIGDQYGAFLAGSEAMKHTRRLTNEEADALIDTHRQELVDHQSDTVQDEVQCLDHLMQSMVRLERDSGPALTMAVSELVAIVCHGHAKINQADADITLQRHGLRVDPIGYTLRVANSHTQLSKLFQGTRWWHCGWNQFLRRLPGVTVAMSSAGKEVSIRFAGGTPTRAIQIPLDLITGDDGPPEHDTMPF